MAAPVLASQIRMVISSDPEMMRCPLGEYAMDTLWLQTPGPRPKHRARWVWDLVGIGSDAWWVPPSQGPVRSPVRDLVGIGSDARWVSLSQGPSGYQVRCPVSITESGTHLITGSLHQSPIAKTQCSKILLNVTPICTKCSKLINMLFSTLCITFSHCVRWG